MAFVRIKKVKGIEYAYYVENKKIDGKVKQTIKQYLGRKDKHEDKFK
jgi:hypothetical protein